MNNIIFTKMELNNREIASLFWIAVFFAWSFWKADCRQAFKQVIVSFLRWKIQLSLAAMAIYIASCVFLLNAIDVWQWSNLKTTVMWSVAFAFMTMFDIRRITEDATYFRKSVRGTVSATAVIMFIAEFYTFSLPVELALVLFLSVTAAIHAFSGSRPEYASVEKFLVWILGLAGLGYLGYGIYQVIENFGEFATYDTAREFAIPIILSLLFLPFLYVLGILTTYGNVFIRLNFLIKDSRALRRYAKWQALLNFRTDLDLLRRWARHIAIFRPNDRENIRGSIREIKEARKREQHPTIVPPSDGWSPYIVKDLLREEGLMAGDYHRAFDGWFASTPCLDVGDGILPDHIAFYVEGNESAAKRLKLTLDVNNPDNPQASEHKFFAIARALLQKVLGEEMGNNVSDQISFKDDDATKVQWCDIHITRDNWSGGIRGGYSRNLIVEHKAD